jgi:hypothetical protein
MALTTSAAVVVRGGCYRLIYRDGGRCSGIIGSGGETGRGRDYLTSCAGKSGNRPAGRPHRVPGALLGSRSRRLNRGGPWL